MKIVSWNVNGLAICRRKGFLKFLSNFNPDIICCQEIKSPCSLNTPGYLPFWYPATRKNYSGTLVLSKLEPLSVAYGLGLRGMDEEGRAITLEYEDYFIINAYFPNLNPHSAPNRPEYRRKWESALRTHIKRLHKPVVLCGDFNVAHAYIDIYPDNQKNTPEEPIFLPEQRAGLDKLFALGLIDVFRSFYPTLEGAYTWWGPRPKSRERNLGSRLDYFLVSECLLEFVRNIQHITDIQMSDHCPILLSLSPVTYHPKTTDEDLAVQWRSADFKQLKGELQKKQREISYAAYKQRWGRVQVLQDELTSSYAARMLAVKTVIDKNSAAGVDHVKWKTDVQAMRAAISLTSRNYRALPYRHLEIELNGKIHIIHVPAAKDKAMLTLYAYAFDPVSEATADKKSFFSRKGRSHFDFHANILAAFQGENPPAWVVVCDVKSFYSNVVHEWLFANIPMDTNVLREFLRAGVIKDGDLFDTTQGISKGAALSSILGNMILDGLQPFIYDRLYPKGNANFQNGNLIRFCDDIIITATSKTSAQLILQVVGEFLAERGLSFNWEKTHITHIENGFEEISAAFS